MKKLFVVFFVLFAFAVQATLPTVTVTMVEKSGVKAYTFTGTKAAIGVADSFIVAPSDGFFTVDEWNQFDPSIYYLSTGETTVDSVRYDIIWQGRTHSGGTWRTLETVTADSSLTWLDVFSQNTYGRWPQMRIIINSGDAKTSIQTLTGSVIFKKDFK